MHKIGQKFPIFQKYPRLCYLDSASTTQTPRSVIVAMEKYFTGSRANVHRGIYDLSVKATKDYEGARRVVAKFINATPAEIIFNSGTTQGLNQLAYSLSPRLSHRDNVVLTRLEHHSNLVSWQQMAKHYGFELRFIELQSNKVVSGQGDTAINFESARKIIDKNTKIVSISLVSNVLGAITPAELIIQLAKEVRAITILDAAQAVAHFPIDVRKLDCDFMCFSGHKMYGPTGIGVLFGKSTMLAEQLEPFFFGGEMVTEVQYDKATWNDIPWKFEAGTPNIAGAIGLAESIKFIEDIGWKNIIKHENKLTCYLVAELLPLATIIGPPDTAGSARIGVVAFNLPGIHPHDVAEILNQQQIAVRAGFHCAEPLHHYLNLNGTVRAALGVYNTEEDVDRLVKGVKKVKKVFGLGSNN